MCNFVEQTKLSVHKAIQRRRRAGARALHGSLRCSGLTRRHWRYSAAFFMVFCSNVSSSETKVAHLSSFVRFPMLVCDTSHNILVSHIPLVQVDRICTGREVTGNDIKVSAEPHVGEVRNSPATIPAPKNAFRVVTGSASQCKNMHCVCTLSGQLHGGMDSFVMRSGRQCPQAAAFLARNNLSPLIRP